MMNLSSNDRILRLMAGFGMVTVEYLSGIDWDIFLLVLGTWGLLTSAFGFCPFYKLLGHSSCPI
ncbi:MAG: hypothetical protein CMA10_06905 [Euryarchaeota archaeon]|nr:hypothetical protein [Euryarchaeota archaeon]